jgi:DNA-binding transcriptional regulator YhcF (GntR family)
MNHKGGEGMNPLIDDAKPIFVQIAERIEDDILTGRLPEDSQIPSTNQFAAFYQINPATAAKGVNLLVDEGILYKRRGIGMFVSPGAREQILLKRKNQFYEQYVLAMMREAEKLGIGAEELVQMILKGKDDLRA